MQAVQRSTRRDLSTAGSRNRRSIGTLQPAAWVWSVQRGRAARLAAEQSPESSSARISRAPSERQLRSAQGEDAHTCWSGALDLGNHKFLADLGHGDSLRQQAPTVNPCSAVLHSPSPNARRARYGLRWEDAEVAEDAGVAQARMLVGLLRDEIAAISDKLKAPDSDVHRRTEHGHHRRVRRAAVLRRQFYEAHRLLDGLYRRFPERSMLHTLCGQPGEECLSCRSTTVAPTASATSIQYATRPPCRYS